MAKDYYNILGINKSASEAEIKKAYKKMAAKYHPDRFASKPESEQKEAENKFKDINEAYQVLSDADKKSHYDRFGSMEGFGQGGFQGGSPFADFNMDDLFSMFGGSHGFGTRTRNNTEPGQSIQMHISLSIEDLFNGIEKDIEYNTQVRCSHCHGEGGEGVETCPYCHGTGMITETRQQGFMTMQSSHPCQHCHGTGKIVKKTCSHCNGSGFETKKQKLHIHIPAGTQEGQYFKYNGKGSEAKDSKAPNGDLILICQYGFDEDKYKVINNTIYELYKVPYYDCILGCTKDVKLPSGKTVKLHIPEYCQSGQQITIYNEGINHGKYIFIIESELPTGHINQDEKDLLSNIQKLHNK